MAPTKDHPFTKYFPLLLASTWWDEPLIHKLAAYYPQIASMRSDWDEGQLRVELSTEAHSRLLRLLSETRKRAADEATMDFLSALSLGLPVDETKLRRFVPLRIYTNDAGTAAALSRAIDGFLATIGLAVVDESEPVLSSWFQKLRGLTKDPRTKKEVLADLKKGKRALELALLNKTQSEIDKNQAEAAALLLKAIEPDSAAVVQIGSILVVRTKDSLGQPKTFVRSLSQEELMLIENDPELVRSPDTILQRLQRAPAVPPAEGPAEANKALQPRAEHQR